MQTGMWGTEVRWYTIENICLYVGDKVYMVAWFEAHIDILEGMFSCLQEIKFVIKGKESEQ